MFENKTNNTKQSTTQNIKRCVTYTMVRVMRAVAVAERARATRRARAVILEERADVERLAARGGWYILNRTREKIVL